MVFGEVDSFFSLMERLRHYLGRAEVVAPASVPTRFIQLFEEHGVNRNQIPRFFGHGLTLNDLKDDESLVAVLSEDILDDVCELFAIRREWLDGADDVIYDTHNFS